MGVPPHLGTEINVDSNFPGSIGTEVIQGASQPQIGPSELRLHGWIWKLR